MNIWFQHHINTSDSLGYVWSMATENPHVPITGEHPGAKSTLCELEKAENLGDMRVSIGDVRVVWRLGRLRLPLKGMDCSACMKRGEW
jgi:hypothetical protein